MSRFFATAGIKIVMTNEQLARFLRKTRSDPKTGCWIWTGHLRGGYGVVGIKRPQDQARKTRGAHRVSFEHFAGSIPAELEIDHLCRNRACVNPKHLEPVTPAENTRRGESIAARWARRTTCDYGHPLWGRNLLRRTTGARGCRLCRIRAQREWRLRQKNHA